MLIIKVKESVEHGRTTLTWQLMVVEACTDPVLAPSPGEHDRLSEH